MWVYFIELLYEKHNSFNEKNNASLRGNSYDDKAMGSMGTDNTSLKNHVLKTCVQVYVSDSINALALYCHGVPKRWKFAGLS